jgi:hypothetical protein
MNTPNGTQPARLPNLDPQVFEWLNLVDSAVAKAPLTRVEHIQVQQAVGGLMKRIEDMQSLLNRVAAEPEPTPTTADGAKMVDEAIDATYQRGVTK